MAELIRIGAYKQGSDPAVDEAIRYYDALEAFLGQRKNEVSDLAAGYSELAALLGLPDPATTASVEEAPAAEAAPDVSPPRADERRDGKECFSTWTSRGTHVHTQKKQNAEVHISHNI